MTEQIIAQTESTMNTLFAVCCIETLVLSIVAGYFTWKLYGWLEQKINDRNKQRDPEWKPITLREWK